MMRALPVVQDGTSTRLAPPAIQQAETDEQLVSLWLHGRSAHTQRAYWGDVARFMEHTGKPLQLVTLGDLQGFADSLRDLAPATRVRTLSAVKSLLGFGYRLGYLAFDVGRALRLPGLENQLAERILPEADVQRILALEPDHRNQTLLRLLYASGIRVSEVCSLKWRNLQPRGEGAGQITVYGKGGKTRAILLPASVWRELLKLRRGALPDDPVFLSAKGGHLDESQVRRIVRKASRRAGILANVSPHWFRHAHASHALDRGAPISLVKETLNHASIATTGKYLHARPNDSSGRYLVV